MRVKLTLLIILCFYRMTSFSQPGLITCSSDRNSDNSISIFAESAAYGEYTVKIIFTSLAGYIASTQISGNISLVTIERGKKELVRLSQNKTASMYQFQYTYQYLPGRALRKAPDSSFVYLLPSNNGNHLRILPVSSLAERIGQKKPEDFSATGFIYKLGDTICASRAGTIYECDGTVKEGEKLNETYKNSRNKIAIQHKDGSLGYYSVLAPIQLLVHEGDYVYAGQPLAVFNKESEKYQILLSNYYLDQKRFSSNDYYAGTKSPSNFIYLPMHFHTGENEVPVFLEVNKLYEVQHPKDVIALEMSKKEKKKFGF